MSATIRPKPSPTQMQDLGPAPEAEVARDLVKRGLMVLPFALVVGFLGWGTDGVASVAYAYSLILINFVVAAALLGWAARISLGLLMGVCLFGFLIRMAFIAVAVLLVLDQPWVAEVPLAVTLVLTHLGLLFWETKFVSASLAFPGLKPSAEEQ